MKKLSIIGVLSILLLSMIGCASKVTINSTHDRYKVTETVLPLSSGKTITLKNAYAQPTKTTIYGEPDGVEWFGDLQQYTDSGIKLLTAELQQRGVKVTGSGGKNISLRVFDVTSGPGWTIRANLMIEAKLGNGKTIKVTSANTSPASAWHAVDGAIMKGITALMQNADFAAYINN